MRRSVSSGAALASCIALLVFGSAQAAPTAGERWSQAPLLLQESADVPPLRIAAGTRVSVLVRLRGEPAWQSFVSAGGRTLRAAASAAAERQRDALRQQQSGFLREAAALGVSVRSQFQFLDNAVALEIEAGQLRALAGLKDVVAVAPVRRYQPAHTTSQPLVRSSEAWAGAALGGTDLTGQGVTIGIIDEGIDYTHRHFGGEGNYEANDRTVLGDVAWPPLVLPAAMGDQLVIGGWDFVGDDYNFGLPAVPDPDPAGCPFSHGTHVAGTAAGYGVTAAGATFTGDLTQGNALFPDYPAASVSAFRIGPGAAPRANLVSLRVFGCSGSTGTDILLAAMEAAATGSWLGEDIDVVNMSLGSAYGGTGPDDFLMGAQQALTELGITVVTSAGNSGDIQLVTGAPGTAAASISVANVTDTAAVIDGQFSYDAGSGATGIPAARGAMYPAISPDPLTATVARISAGIEVACVPLTEPDPTAWDGKWLLVDRGTCSFSQKIANVKATGAAGAIVINNDASAPFAMGVTGGFDDALPAIMVAQADGLALKALVGEPGFDGTFDSASGSSYPETPRLANGSTSRGGVVRGSDDRILKPNLAAPGTSITSAGAGTNNEGYTISGTSMASPHVAGLAALLIEGRGRPTDAAGVAELKQRLMSTATRDIALFATDTPPLHSPQRVGSGLVDVVEALDAPLIAFATDVPENGSVSFGYPRQLVGSGPQQFARSITLRNLSGSDITLDASYVPRSTWPGASVAVSPAQILVPGHGVAAAEVTLTLDAEQPDLNVSGDPAYNSASRTFLHEVSGLAAFSFDGGSRSVRVPVYAAPHLVANTSLPVEAALSGAIGSTTLTVVGEGFNLGTDSNDHVSLVSAYQLLASDGIESELFWDVDGDGIAEPGEQLVDYAYADLEHVGVATAAGGPGELLMFLGLSMHGEWTTPRDLFVEAYVDVDQDGNDDYAWFYGSGASDQFFVSFVPLIDGRSFSFNHPLNYVHGSQGDSMLLRNNVLSMPIVLSNDAFTDNGWPNYASGPVRVRVFTYQRDSDFSLPIDSVEGSFWPGLSIQGQLANAAVAVAGSGIELTHDFVALPVPTILSLHHHNADRASRAQLTTLTGGERPDAMFASGFETVLD